MTSELCHNVFEQLSGHPFASSGIRPGGLELTRRALVLSRLASGDAALDVGCGPGVTVDYLIREHAIQAVGVDTSSLLVAQGKAKDDALPLLLADGETLPFADESFDGVLLECALSLVQDHARVLRECHRVLKPLGRIIVTDLYARRPDAVQELRRLSVRSCVRGALHKDQFFDECLSTGFGFACFEDHSDLLRDFAVRMIWTYGSLDQFWTQAGAWSLDPGPIRQAIREARLGYFLLVGFKTVSVCQVL
jgi:arsenite methyltransferase